MKENPEMDAAAEEARDGLAAIVKAHPEAVKLIAGWLRANKDDAGYKRLAYLIAEIK